MADQISNINSKILSFFTGLEFLNIIGWILVIVIIAGASIYGYYWYTNKKKFKKKISVFEGMGDIFDHSFNDLAKVIKLGKGGFEILYLKKLKTWKLAYGGRVGKNTYYFFIMDDGYWYNGLLSKNIFKIDELKGLIPIVTTNPSMRSQYTALEKQIDTLHKEDKSFMDKYGVMIFSIGFLVIAGLFLWLNYKQFTLAMGNLNTVTDRLAELIDKANTILGNARGLEGQGGLKPA